MRLMYNGNIVTGKEFMKAFIKGFIKTFLPAVFYLWTGMFLIASGFVVFPLMIEALDENPSIPLIEFPYNLIPLAFLLTIVIWACIFGHKGINKLKGT